MAKKIKEEKKKKTEKALLSMWCMLTKKSNIENKIFKMQVTGV